MSDHDSALVEAATTAVLRAADQTHYAEEIAVAVLDAVVPLVLDRCRAVVQGRVVPLSQAKALRDAADWVAGDPVRTNGDGIAEWLQTRADRLLADRREADRG